MMVEGTTGSESTADGLAKALANGDSDSPFSDELARVFGWLTFSVLCQVVCLFGVGSNVINIVCFIKQGFNDPVNVSFFGLLLLRRLCCVHFTIDLVVFPFSSREVAKPLSKALAVADIGCLVTIMFTNLCLGQLLNGVDLPFEAMEFQHLTFAIPHTAFTRISSWITALITLERCLCITAPMKVKSIVTTKRVSITVFCIYFVLIANIAPVYVVNKLGLKFYPDRNRTLIGILPMGDREGVEMVFYIINNACVPFVGFMIIITCTIILVIQLRKKAKWRKASSVSAQGDNVSKRNQSVAKMAVMISVLFISCFTPICVLCIAMGLEPEFSVVGKYRNGLVVFGGLGVLLESINSSANIFIYYHMSTLSAAKRPAALIEPGTTGSEIESTSFMPRKLTHW